MNREPLYVVTSYSSGVLRQSGEAGEKGLVS